MLKAIESMDEKGTMISCNLDYCLDLVWELCKQKKKIIIIIIIIFSVSSIKNKFGLNNILRILFYFIFVVCFCLPKPEEKISINNMQISISQIITSYAADCWIGGWFLSSFFYAVTVFRGHLLCKNSGLRSQILDVKRCMDSLRRTDGIIRLSR